MRRRRCLIRVAAGPRVGYGHLMRARALMQCLDMDVVLSVRGGTAAKAAASAVAPVVDRTALAGADVVIVDDPNFAEGQRWIARAHHAGARAVSVQDYGPAHDADLIICPGLGQRRPRTAVPTLAGTRFYLLDRHIASGRRLRNQRQDGPPLVVVALGGGQHVRAVAQRLVDAIAARRADARIVVAAGFSLAPQRPLRGATWLNTRTGLAPALQAADVAVVAGGVTLYEACALGVPAVGFAVVPGQRRAIRAFAAAGALLDAGGGVAAIEIAADGVARLVAQRSLRLRTGARARRLVDGQGALRVAKTIHALVAREDHRG